jgi:hypothetical protein
MLVPFDGFGIPHRHLLCGLEASAMIRDGASALGKQQVGAAVACDEE